MRYPDPWLELIIKNEVAEALKRQREKVLFLMLQVGMVILIGGFAYAMWKLGHKAACG
jgi:flagellar basal body-associated protein FliL